MMRKKKYLLLSLLILISLLSSCRWEILSNNVNAIQGEDYTSDTFAVFTGEAPKNVRASKGASTSTITVSFSPVQGADYYHVYRADVQRSVDVNEIDLDELTWKRIQRVDNPANARILSITDEIRDNFVSSDGLGKNATKFLYRVQAGSDYTDTYYFIEGEYSDVVIGYTLSPPLSLSATKGKYDDRVELSWDQIEGATGYSLYYTDDITKDNISNWNLIQSGIPYSTVQDKIGYTFRPDSALAGKELYFAVVSVGRDGNSDRSGYDTGYTYVPGAPTEPQNARATQYESPNYIAISWDGFGTLEENEKLAYEWTIRRKSGTSDAVEVLHFTSADFRENGVEDLSIDENGRYTYIDRQNLEPHVEYSYSIFASCMVETEANPEGEMLPGQAKEDVIGTIMSPPTEYKLTVDFSNDTFTIDVTNPEGFESGNGWEYVVQGRMNNVLDPQPGSWKELTTVPVNSQTEIVSDFNIDGCNEFRLAVKNKEGEITVYSDPITASNRMQAPAFTVSANVNYEGISEYAPENGMYPVILNISGHDGDFTKYVLTISNDGIFLKDLIFDTAEIENIDYNLTEHGYAPDEILVQYEYQLRGVDKYNSYSEQSPTLAGYGALTPEKFIKVFEMFVLKPWEFLNNEWFKTNYPDLVYKWTASEIKAKIDAGNKSGLTEQMGALTDGAWIYENTDFHDGRIGYRTSKTSEVISSMSSDIYFSFTNAGEAEGIYGNGSYAMRGVGTNGSGSCGGTITVEGMYPATVNVPTTISNRAFSGKYNIIMKYSNGEVSEQVEATTNN